MAEQKRPPITYADSRADLPKSAFAERLAELRIARTFAKRSAAQEQDNTRLTPVNPHQDQDRSMVAKDRPHPAPRPSLPFADDVDAASFDARWEAERRRANQPNPNQTQGDRSMSDQFHDEAESTPRRPTETLREGPLKAAIWRNETEHGPYHSVTLARTYKDREGNLQDTSSFRAKDMLGLSELARRAHHEAHEQDRAAFKEHRLAQSEQAQTQSKGHTH